MEVDDGSLASMNGILRNLLKIIIKFSKHIIKKHQEKSMFFKILNVISLL